MKISLRVRLRLPSKARPGSSFEALALGLVLIILSTGCGTMPNGRGWGQDATITPGWGRIGRAALSAATAPETWAPAAGALALRIGHADRNLQEWAARGTPVFGSQRAAEQRSDDFLNAAGVIWAVTGVATPGGEDPGLWLLNKAKGLAVEAGAGAATSGIVDALKGAVGRTRPGGGSRASFPSAHAAGSSFFATLSSRHVDTYGWSSSAVTASRLGLGALTAATAWARVEANQHFPSDVLAGIALGHFMGAFVTEAFLGLDNPRNAALLIEPSKDGVAAMVRFGF
jgi:membrane-associated phospholipid phosphatase